MDAELFGWYLTLVTWAQRRSEYLRKPVRYAECYTSGEAEQYAAAL